MKALTLHQPWAQLIALGVKTIETRSWATNYRGPLVIHAGQHQPTEGMEVGDWRATFRPDVTLPREFGGATLPGRWLMYRMEGEGDSRLPFGAIVASCKLVDCVPITEEWLGFPDVKKDPGWWIIAPAGSSHLYSATYNGSGITTSPLKSEFDCRPYGDFTRGRFAWLLEDIQPVEKRCPACCGGKLPVDFCWTCNGQARCLPIPAKGKQGLWEWTP